MIETKLVISICVAVFFFGMLIGLAIMGLASTESYKKGYEDGYRKGKVERNANDGRRNKEKLQAG